jgi:DNA-binding NtrC family response regulator
MLVSPTVSVRCHAQVPMGRRIAEHFILVIENDAVIALDVAYALQSVGTRVVTSDSVELAFELVECDVWSAVVLGPTLNEIDSSLLCEQLQERGIPFLLYTGTRYTKGACAKAPRVHMPSGPAALVQAVEDLVHRSLLH